MLTPFQACSQGEAREMLHLVNPKQKAARDSTPLALFVGVRSSTGGRAKAGLSEAAQRTLTGL